MLTLTLTHSPCHKQIKAILPDAVYVSFLGWSSTYDTWLHMARHADRIRPLGAKTIAETHEVCVPRSPTSPPRLLAHTFHTITASRPPVRSQERERKEAEETFVAIMQTCGRTVIKMESDGNCLFRALAHQVTHAHTKQYMPAPLPHHAACCSVVR